MKLYQIKHESVNLILSLVVLIGKGWPHASQVCCDSFQIVNFLFSVDQRASAFFLVFLPNLPTRLEIFGEMWCTFFAIYFFEADVTCYLGNSSSDKDFFSFA